MKRTEKIQKLVKAAKSVATTVEKKGIKGFGRYTCFDADGKPVDFIGHVVKRAGFSKTIDPQGYEACAPAFAVAHVLGVQFHHLPDAVKTSLGNLAQLADGTSETPRRKNNVAKALREFAELLTTNKIVATKTPPATTEEAIEPLF